MSMLSTVAQFSPNTVQVLAIVAAVLFALSVLVTLLRPALLHHMVLIGAGLTVLAIATIFMV